MPKPRRKSRRYTIQIRVSREERAELRAKAKSDGLDVSKWTRKMLLGQKDEAT